MGIGSHLSTCVDTQSPKYLEMAQGHISLSSSVLRCAPGWAAGLAAQVLPCGRAAVLAAAVGASAVEGAARLAGRRASLLRCSRAGVRSCWLLRSAPRRPSVLRAWQCRGAAWRLATSALRRWPLERRRSAGAGEEALPRWRGGAGEDRTEEGRSSRAGGAGRGRARCGAGAGEEVRPRGTTTGEPRGGWS
jgi:hypothetical protein